MPEVQEQQQSVVQQLVAPGSKRVDSRTRPCRPVESTSLRLSMINFIASPRFNIQPSFGCLGLEYSRYRDTCATNTAIIAATRLCFPYYNRHSAFLLGGKSLILETNLLHLHLSTCQYHTAIDVYSVTKICK